MQIVIRSRENNVYVGKKETWTPDAAMARPFETHYHALYFCVSNNLDGTDIVDRMPDGREIAFLRC